MGSSSGGARAEETIDLQRPVDETRQVSPTPNYPDLVEVDPSHYVIGKELGKGGMGRVFEAVDRRTGRTVALKEPSGGDLGRFIQEARITAGLQHPGIVAVYEAGAWPDGEPFYAMRRVEGRSLREVVAETTTLRERLALLPHAIAAGDALAYAHDHRVIHRDLTPRNVLVGEFGDTVIIDWGLAKDLSAPGAARMSGRLQAVRAGDTGGAVGTAAYMPPEQAENESIDQRTDVYALGALLYFMLSGTAPYEGEEILEQVIAGPPIPLAGRDRLIPADLVAIAEKAMARDPDDRYASAAEMVAEIKTFQQKGLVSAYRYSPLERVGKLIGRYRAAVAVAVAALAVLAVLATFGVMRIVGEREEAERQRAEAERQRLQLLEERGRQEVVEGRSGRGLAYLAAALEAGHATTASQLLIAEARRPFDRQVLRIDAHGDQIARGVAFSRDDKLLLSYGDDGAARLWSIGGEQVAELSHGGPVYRAVFSSRGDRIATASADRSAALWTTAGERVATLQHAGPVYDAAFSGVGDRLVTASADGTAAVWDATTGERLGAIEQQTALVDAELSDDGTRVVAATIDGVAIAQGVDGRNRVVLSHGAPVTSVALSWDTRGEKVVTTGGRVARVWDARTGAPIATLQGHTEEVVSAVFRRDDARVLTASRDRTARVFDAASGALVATLTGHSDALRWAGFGGDQRLALTASKDGALRLWIGDTGAALLSFEGHASAVNAAAFAGDGPRFASAGDDGTIRLWKMDNPAVRSWIETRFGKIVDVAFSPDGELVATGSTDKTARLWDVATGEEVSRVIKADNTIFAVAFSPAGDRLATATTGAVRIHGLGGERAAVDVSGIGAGERVLALDFAPDGRRLAIGTDRGRVGIVEDGRVAAMDRRHDQAVGSVRFAADGARLISASYDRTARVWNVATGEQELSIDGGGAVDDALFFRGGYLLCGAAGARAVDRAGEPLLELAGAGSVDSCDLRRDSAVIATASRDRVTRLWDAETGKLLTSREGQTLQLSTARFSADGDSLATAGYDSTVAIWNVAPNRSTAAELGALLEQVPWRLVDNRLDPRGR
jgi:WD40 repeat protein